MTVNKAGLDLITEFEGFVPNWYPDPAHGWKVPTCCYGHTDAAGEPKYAATKDKKFTKAEGLAILKRDLVQYEDAVRSAVKVPLNENQHAALTSFTFNLGAANLKKSTLVKLLNAGDYEGAAKQFARWNQAGGKVMAGLTRRRKAEAELFLLPVKAIPTQTIGEQEPSDAIAPPPIQQQGKWLGWTVAAAIAILLALGAIFIRF